MQRNGLILVCILVLLAGASMPDRSFSVLASQHVQSAANKKTCKTVIKKVHGKKKKVKVCHTVKPTPTPTPIPAPTSTPTPPDVRAQQLADAVYTASSADARNQALLAVMRALHLGVYSPDGHHILAGSERGTTDLYLYDFELGTIGSALAAGRTFSLDTLAALLSHAGFTKSDGSHLDATSVQALLAAAIQAGVSSTGNSQALEPLLLRQLGLHHTTPNDLAGTAPIQLDALELVLIAADLLGTQVHVTPLRALSAEAALHSPLLRSHQANCGDFGMGVSDNHWILSWLADQSRGKFMTTQTEVGTLTGAFHSTVLGIVMLRTDIETPNGLETHYGPSGHAPNAGMPLIFRVHVTLDVPAPVTVSCGVLTGLDIPSAGPLPNVLVTMDTGSLERYGTVTYNPSDRHTGSNGVVQMTFQPKDEVVPDFGGVVTASDFVQTSTTFHAYDSTRFGQFLAVAGADIIPLHWSVSRHAPRGFKFDGITWHTQTCYDTHPGCDNVITTDFSGRICGETPYDTWQMRWQWTIDDTYPGAPAQTYFDYPERVPLMAGPNKFQGGAAGDAALTFVATPAAPTMRASITAVWNIIGLSQIEVPVSEDMNCPPPTP